MKTKPKRKELPIDFVIPYVCGDDPVWVEKMLSFLPDDRKRDPDMDRQYRNWDFFKYWFRGVDRFAPWVHKVFVITDHQAPDWLDHENEKLVLINHEDYIPPEYLPVFSSHPIELNLHRIPGLSEQFVYFNDDMVLTAPVVPEDFFRDGLPCDFAIEQENGASDRLFSHIVTNDILFLNRHYSRKEYISGNRKKHYSPVVPTGAVKNFYLSFYRRKRGGFLGFYYNHVASSYLKTTFSEVWEEDTEGWLDETCSHRFRSSDDVNQYVFKQHQYVRGLYSPYNWHKKSKFIKLRDGENGTLTEAAAAIGSGNYKLICLNDSYVHDFQTAKSVINDALSALFPDPCSFEKEIHQGNTISEQQNAGEVK